MVENDGDCACDVTLLQPLGERVDRDRLGFGQRLVRRQDCCLRMPHLERNPSRFGYPRGDDTHPVQKLLPSKRLVVPNTSDVSAPLDGQ